MLGLRLAVAVTGAPLEAPVVVVSVGAAVVAGRAAVLFSLLGDVRLRLQVPLLLSGVSRAWGFFLKDNPPPWGNVAEAAPSPLRCDAWDLACAWPFVLCPKAC